MIVKYSLRLGFSRAHLFWVPTGKDINKRNLLLGIACAGRNRIREFKNVLFPFQGWFDLDLIEDVSNAVFIRTLHQENSPELKELRGYRLPVFEAAILPIRQSNILKGLLLLDFDQINER